MQRREFVAGVMAATATPLFCTIGARAQRRTVPVIGLLSNAPFDLSSPRLRAFREGLNETGKVEGRDLTIEYRSAEDRYDRLPALVAELIGRGATVIVALDGPSARAAKAVTSTIPIVFQMAGDPVAAGLVTSLARPGGNLSGVTTLGTALGPKRLELLHELIPTATIIGLLINPTNPNADLLSKELHVAANALGVALHILPASTDSEIEAVFAILGQLGVGGLVIVTDVFFTNRITQLGSLSLQHAVPAVFQYRDFAAAGGLVAYGGNFTDSHRRAGIYTGRVLKGEKPAGLPVQQVTKIELIVNLKAAKALRLAIPTSLLDRADEVIE
jgi:putative tryptophan/tyrosine transport system substrate-binding protein